MSLKKIPSFEEAKTYTPELEQKDVERFSKIINELSNSQFAVMFSVVMGEYSNSNLCDALDYTLNPSIKEELVDLWSFRIQTGLVPPSR